MLIIIFTVMQTFSGVLLFGIFLFALQIQLLNLTFSDILCFS